MGQRIDLHEVLIGVLGARNVYFQPPESIKLIYPCIIYGWSSNDTKFADDGPYFHKRRYTVTVIDKNPDSEIPDKLARLQLCVLNRCYIADNLNHYVFTLYY